MSRWLINPYNLYKVILFNGTALKGYRRGVMFYEMFRGEWSECQ